MEQTDNNGFTFEQACQSIWKHILIVLGTTLLITIATVLTFLFAINPNHMEYRLDFLITYPTSQTMKYPDGTPFYYRDMISLSYLNEAKASDEKFANIDVRKMVEEDDIDITANERETNGVSSFTGKYKITVKGRYFPDRATATDFIRAIAEIPVTRVKNMAAELDYSLDKTTFESASFADRLTLLQAQKQSILKQYDEWIELYRENYPASGKTLRNLRAGALAVFSDGTLKSLSKEMEDCGYVPVSAIPARKVALEEEKELNEAKIKALEKVLDKAGASGSESYSLLAETKPSDESQTVIAVTQDPSLSTLLGNLIARNEQIDFQIKKLTEANVTSFISKLNAEYEALNAEAQTMTAVAGSIYSQESIADFQTAKAEAIGGSSVAVAGIAAVVLSFLAASCVVCVYDRIRKNKQAKAAAEKPAVTTQSPAEKILAKVTEPQSEFSEITEIPVEPLFSEQDE